ncbi:MAG: peroxidase-related enzyme [Deinococcota bacterium]
MPKAKSTKNGQATSKGRKKSTKPKKKTKAAAKPAPKTSKKAAPPENLSWLHTPTYDELPEVVQTMLDSAKQQAGMVPNVMKIFSLTPEHFVMWFDYYNFLQKRDDSTLSRKEREMVALVVSSENECEYCLASHSAFLRALDDSDEAKITADVLVHNYRRAELSERERAMCDFAIKMTKNAAEMTPDDLTPLRDIGLNDAEIFELAQVAAMFNFTNRLANALGWKPNEEYYSQHR